VPADTGNFGSVRRSGIALILVVIAAIGLRLLGLDRSLSVDEAWTVAQAAAPDFWTTAQNDVHPPLYYFLVRCGLKITPSFIGLRLFSVGCGLGLLVLAILPFCKRPAAAVVAGAAVAALPGFILFAQQIRSYSLLFVLLAVALALAVQIFLGVPDLRTRIMLSLVLMAAAATHLVTVFFLLALAPLLLWPARRGKARSWIAALLPLVPPGLLALWFKFFFITPPGTLAGGWWMTVDTGTIINALGEAVGWAEMQWLADAWSRHAPGNGWPVLGLAIAAALFAITTAWGRRQSDPLVWALLASAMIYTAAVIAYSCFFEHVVMTRTLLPGLLPLLAGLAWGIGTHPVAWRRTMAATAVVIYVALTAMPVVRRAATPDAGLRGLAAVTRVACRPGDLLVLFRAMDYSLAAYNCPPAGTETLQFDQTQPSSPQMLELQRRLGQLDRRSRVLVVYRDDYYLEQFRAVFDLALAKISGHGRTPRTVWKEVDLALIVAEPSSDHLAPP
jgi:hypothetical protein